jgi:hypothetical protein
MYFLLTGKSPVPDGNVTQKLLFQQKHDPPPITNYRKDVPEELIAVVTKLMKKAAAERFQTPAELIPELAPLTDATPTSPPDYEMPDLCPAVASLTGHMMDKRRKAAAVAAMASTSGRLLKPGSPSSGSGAFSAPSSASRTSDVCLLNPEAPSSETIQTKGFASYQTPVATPGPLARSASIFATPPPLRREFDIGGDSTPDSPSPLSGPASAPAAVEPPPAPRGRKGLLIAIAVAALVVVGGGLFAAFGR